MTDNTESLKQQQLKFERTRKLKARQKYRRDQHKMIKEMKGGYLSGTNQGRAAVVALYKKITPQLEKIIAKKAKSVYCSEDIAQAVVLSELIGPDKLVGISLKAIVDTLGKYDELKATKVLAACGSRLKVELYRQFWDLQDNNLMSALEQKYKYAGIHHKLMACKVILGKSTGFTTSDIDSLCGSLSFTIAASWVLTAVNSVCDWFKVETRHVAKNKAQNFVKLTPAFTIWFQQYGVQVERELMTLYPMLCPPRAWSYDGKDGGYLEPVGRVSKLIKDEIGRNSKPSKKQVDYINNMAKTSHEINPAVLDLQEHLFHMSGGSLGSFTPIQYHPLTSEPMPDYIQALESDHPARVEWRKEKHAINTANAESRRKGVRCVSNISAARLFKNIEKFYIPYASDTRGRTYVLSAGALSPQGSDAERALLRFHEGAPITDEAIYYLSLHLANCYGISESHEAKLKWVEENKDLISDIALNPLDHLELLEKVDEPFQFFAACDEYYHCVITGERKDTKLPIAMDATASGLQILSMLARDKSTAELTNLIPGMGQKMDIYAALKPLVKKHLDAYRDEYGNPAPYHLKKLHLPRKAYKVNLMTRCYGSVIRSRRSKIRDLIMQTHNYQHGLLEPGDAQILAQCFENAMVELAEGALKIYDSLALIGKTLAKQRSTAHWSTPGGTYVEVAPFKNPTKRVNLGWFGKLCLANPKAEPVLDHRKVHTSLAPSFVHSLDANILHEAFHDWNKPLVTIHDCISLRATDMKDALDRMLKAYTTVLRDGKSILDNLAKDNDVPITWNQTNTLTDKDIDNIQNCDYTLC